MFLDPEKASEIPEPFWVIDTPLIRRRMLLDEEFTRFLEGCIVLFPDRPSLSFPSLFNFRLSCKRSPERWHDHIGLIVKIVWDRLVFDLS